MDWLHVSYFKMVAAGGDLSAAPDREVTKDAVAVNIEPVIVEHHNSKTPQPVRRYDIGTNIGIQGVLSDGTLDDVALFTGGAVAVDVFTKNAVGVRQLPKQDIEIGVFRPSDGAVKKWTLTNMEFTQSTNLQLQQGNANYLPFNAAGTSTTVLTIDNAP